MIPFNIFGHSNTAGEDNEPIVWVDSSDNSSYTLSGSDVTALFNKGSLGGAMTLNGTVKFANNGFESWSNADYISRFISNDFLTTNSFTLVTTLEHSQNTINNNQFYSEFISNSNNRLTTTKASSNFGGYTIYSGNSISNTVSVINSLKTYITTYDLSTNSIIILNENGNGQVFNNVLFDSSFNTRLTLLSSIFITNTYSGANNPLHEFRLYDRAFTLTEMQDLQTELNDKYTP